MNAGRLIRIHVAALALVAAAPQAQAAGLFENLAHAIFGGPAQPVIRSGPLEMTVRPRQQRVRRAAPPETKPSPPLVKLDPATDPDWYLSDPTLRRGDIIVTGTGVVVYDGRTASAGHSPADFIQLSRSRALPREQQRMLEAAAASGRRHLGDFGDKPTAREAQAPRVSAAD